MECGNYRVNPAPRPMPDVRPSETKRVDTKSMQAHAVKLKTLHASLLRMRRTNISGAAAFELQMSVLAKIRRLERRIRSLRTLVETGRARLAGKSGPRLSKVEAMALKNRIERHQAGIDRCRRALVLTGSPIRMLGGGSSAEKCLWSF